MKYIKKDLINFNLNSRSMRPVDFFEQTQKRDKIWLSKNKTRIVSDDTIFCKLCGEKIDNIFLEWKDGYKLLQCKSCKAYSANVNGSKIENAYQGQSKANVKVNPKKFEYFSRERYNYTIERLNLSKNDSNILDVGCGPGYFVEYLDKKEFKVSGIEVDSDLVEKCLERNLNVSSKNLNELPNENYNLITLFDVLEHLDKPIEYFKALRKKIKNSGYIVMYTPYINSIAFELMESKQNLLAPFQHLCFFNEESIDYLAKITGLKIYSIEHYGLDMMDYLLMKEYEDKFPYTEKLKDMMNLVQSCLDFMGVSNHMRITLTK